MVAVICYSLFVRNKPIDLTKRIAGATGTQNGGLQVVSEHADFSHIYYNHDILKGLGERPRGLYLLLGGK